MYTRNWLPEVFNDFFENSNLARANATAPAINVKENKEGYTVELAAPGLRKEDFDVSVNHDGDLVIRMENRHNDKEEDKNTHYLRREFSYSKYEQTLVLPDDIDKAKISARVADGVLTIELPKLSKEQPKVGRQIEIG